jgi:hypothetical protein
MDGVIGVVLGRRIRFEREEAELICFNSDDRADAGAVAGEEGVEVLNRAGTPRQRATRDSRLLGEERVLCE